MSLSKGWLHCVIGRLQGFGMVAAIKVTVLALLLTSSYKSHHLLLRISHPVASNMASS